MGKELSAALERLIVENAERVIVMMDGGPPGREAQAEIVARLSRRVHVRAVELSEGSQPDTIPEKELPEPLSVPS